MVHSQMHTVVIYCVIISNAYAYSTTVCSDSLNTDAVNDFSEKK